jgi:hypothetical protein
MKLKTGKNWSEGNILYKAIAIRIEHIPKKGNIRDFFKETNFDVLM